MKKVNVILFFVIIFTVAVLNMVFMNSSGFSRRENRELAGFPEFSQGGFVSGDYFESIDSYISDHFVRRDELVDVSSKIREAMSKNGVKRFINNEKIKNISVLSLDGEKSAVVKYNDNVYFVFDGNKAQINRYTKAVNFMSYNFEENVDISVMLVPTALEFVQDSSELFGISSQRDMIDRAERTLNDNIVFADVYDTMKEHADEYIYFRTDHHWTPMGAYYSYRRFADMNGYAPTDCRLEISGEFCGSFADFTNSAKVRSLSDMMSIQKIEAEYWCHGGKSGESDAVLMADMYPEEFDGYKRILGGDTGYIRIETMNKTDDRLLVIKDSYANALIPYLTEHYNRIIMIDPRYFEGDIYATAKKEKITDVLIVNNTETISDVGFIEKLEEVAGKDGRKK